MNADSLRAVCREHADGALRMLVMQCRHRFVLAAELMEWRSPVLDRVRQLGTEEPVDVWLLAPAFSVLCDRYIAAFYSPQRELLASVADEPDQKWWAYFVHELLPHLLADDEVVRNVLRSLNALPCRDPQEAARALEHHVREMTLPGSQPAWAPV